MFQQNILHVMQKMAEAQSRKIFGAQNIESYIKRYALKSVDHRYKARGSIAKLNRHTGAPHQHARAAARHLRQGAAS